MPTIEPKIYLTFDDGPIPEITEFVLDQLNIYNAKATFFCIGVNVVKNPEIFNKILANGHSIGNHTMNHLKGWNTDNQVYIDNFKQCNQVLEKNDLFRPPYGKISQKQATEVMKTHKIIMWDVLAGDFLPNLQPEKCLEKCIKYTKPGSIIVFHDSIKAAKIMTYVLPRYLAYFQERGFSFEPIVLK